MTLNLEDLEATAQALTYRGGNEQMLALDAIALIAKLREADDAMNVLSGISPTAINARKARCIRGHEFDGTDRRGWRYCTQCHNEKRRQRRNASRSVPGTTNNESEQA